MADKDIFIRYISYFMGSLSPLVPQYEKAKILRQRLGTDINKVTVSKLRKMAFSMYFAHFVSLTFSVDSWSLIVDNVSLTNLKSALIEGNEIREKYKIGTLPVVYHTTDKKVISHMKTMDGKISTLQNIVKEEIKVVRKPATRRTTARKPATRRTTTKKVSGKKTCADYKVTELRPMAAEANIRGRSKMRKAELCKALGISA